MIVVFTRCFSYLFLFSVKSIKQSLVFGGEDVYTIESEAFFSFSTFKSANWLW